ncbi:hypothetical protein ASD66_07380 [Nocardioides sp. Root151]|nr:hypothetical protein ASD30_15265 [Nocardioides sp. Root140]KQZ76090.1 hypothetical protein ASD66_07380 [Nocardioides sp. Root151]KRF20260.1 hypothetical protein ASH02_21275 [Nocardioides sp. Soil796]
MSRMGQRFQKPASAPSGRLRSTTIALAVAAVLASVAAALCSVLGFGPDWLDQAAAVTISTVYAVALAARTGGRPFIFGALALAMGLTTVISDMERMRTGAAVLTAVISSVLAVMATVPARKFRLAAREVCVTVVVGCVGSLGVVGFRPTVSLERYDYVSLALAFMLVVVLVYRLGAGLHGLGRRGLIVVAVGTVALTVALAYAELIRRYGSEEFVDDILDGVRWMRANLGAVPRPIQVLVGVPALVYGTHLRARRRQGWWICAFGVGSTCSVSGILINPMTGWLEAALIIVYSTILGLGLGYVVIRVDLALTGPRGSRARRAEEQTASRPESSRFRPLR